MREAPRPEFPKLWNTIKFRPLYSSPMESTPACTASSSTRTSSPNALSDLSVLFGMTFLSPVCRCPCCPGLFDLGLKIAKVPVPLWQGVLRYDLDADLLQ